MKRYYNCATYQNIIDGSFEVESTCVRVIIAILLYVQSRMSTNNNTDSHYSEVSRKPHVLEQETFTDTSNNGQNTLDSGVHRWLESVFGRWTFLALCPICGWHWQVTTLWVNCPLWFSQLG